jgi:hypothetical protein
MRSPSLSLVGQDDRAGPEMVEQMIYHRRIMRLTAAQAESDREPMGIDDDVDLGREPAAGATETMISPPF